MSSTHNALRRVEVFERVGRVAEVRGQSIESEGPDAFLGEVCTIRSALNGQDVMAEVVGFHGSKVCLTPFSDIQGISVGAPVIAQGHVVMGPVGNHLLGRVVNALGRPIDDKGELLTHESRPLRGKAQPVLSRRRIDRLLQTGVKAIDSFLPLGEGQRVGLFAGSGVGKSTLMGMITRGVKADINVVALIGERGREVREFIEDHLGEEGLARAVVVVATADEPAVMRLNAAYYATVIAEYFREQGKAVLLTMDSLTRLAMARREIGLSAGEPPTSRGYTPAVFSEIPALCERCGTDAGKGSITGIYTVLVEGDDFNEPISDTVRATLDGHIMLSRELAASGQYPPIDLLGSISRLASSLWSPQQRALIDGASKHLAIYERNRQLIEIGAHHPGINPLLDQAIEMEPKLRAVAAQSANQSFDVAETWAALSQVLTDAPNGAGR